MSEHILFLTGKLAGFFGLHERGVIEVGKSADIAMFNLDEVECRPEEKIWDVFDGKGGRTYRYTRAPAPMSCHSRSLKWGSRRASSAWRQRPNSASVSNGLTKVSV